MGVYIGRPPEYVMNSGNTPFWFTGTRGVYVADVSGGMIVPVNHECLRCEYCGRPYGRGRETCNGCGAPLYAQSHPDQ